MKRILIMILTLALCLPVFSGCTPKQFKNLNESDIKVDLKEENINAILDEVKPKMSFDNVAAMLENQGE